VGALECSLEAIEAIDIGPDRFAEYRAAILAVETERYGGASQYPPDVLRAGPRPLLQFPPEMLARTVSNPGALCVPLRARVSGGIVPYALGSALEGHEEEGVSSDPRLGERDTFYLQAMATLPSVKNHVELENRLLELIRERALSAGYTHLSTLIEERVRETGPGWFRDAQEVLAGDNSLRSGMRFVSLHVPLSGPPAMEPAPVGGDRRREAP